MAENNWSSDLYRDSLQGMEFDLNGARGRGIQSLKLEEEVAREPVYGNGQTAIGMPAGTHKASGEFVTIPSEWDVIMSTMGSAITENPGSIGISLRRPNGTIYTVTLTSVYINNAPAEFGKAGGADPSLFTVPFVVLDPIDWNGLRMVQTPTDPIQFVVNLFGGFL